MADEPAKSSRSFSKRVLVANALLAWGAIYFAIAQGQAEAIAASGFALIAALYGAYTGIGHLDYRSVLAAGAAPAAPEEQPRAAE